MTLVAPLIDLPPVLLAHIAAATAALLLGPVALTARKGSPLHRSAGYLWVALMLVTATSSLFIRDFRLPNLAGYTPIHLFALATYAGLAAAIAAVLRRDIRTHRRRMWATYLGGCVVAGLFTLLPGRLLGQLLWHQAPGLV